MRKGDAFRAVVASAEKKLATWSRVPKRHRYQDPTPLFPVGRNAVRCWCKERLEAQTLPDFMGEWRVSCNLARQLGDKYVRVKPELLLQLLDILEGRS
jgi:hypothetical protein